MAIFLIISLFFYGFVLILDQKKKNLATKLFCCFHDSLFTSPGQYMQNCLRQHWNKQLYIYQFLCSKNIYWYILFLYKNCRINEMELGGVYKISSLGASYCYELKPKNLHEELPKILNWKPSDVKMINAVPHKLKTGSTFFVTKIEKNPNLKMNYLYLGNGYVLVEILLEGNKRYLVHTEAEYEKQALSLAYRKLA